MYKHTLRVRHALTVAITLALACGTAAAQQAQADAIEGDAQSTTTVDGNATTLEKVEVTGSRIKRTEAETVDPIQVFTAQDLARQGFSTLYDALSNLSVNTGVFVGEEDTNNFNANAQALNLRGFGPGYTLVLLNGRRIPVLPKPAGNISGNVINLAMIPASAVERVEVLTSGASAIYGSDAVAGVVNIILKEGIDETTFRYRYGNTANGGGRSDNFTVSSGFRRGDMELSYGLEWDRRLPIRGDQRDWFSDPSKSPDPDYRSLSQVMSYWDRGVPGGWGLLDIGDRCAGLGYQAQRPGWAGPGPEQYCGDNEFDTYTVRNGRERIFAFGNLRQRLGEHEFSATLLSARSTADAGLYRYSYGVDYDVMEDPNDLDSTYYGSRQVWRAFRDFETPTSNQHFSETSHIFSAALSGPLGRFDYNLGYSYGQYRYRDSVSRFDDQAMLGLLFGSKGTDWAQPWAPDRWITVRRDTLDGELLPTQLDFFGTLTPDMFADAVRTSVGDGRSTSQTISADVSGELFNLPSGAVQFAAVVEASRDTYRFLTDLPTVNGELYGWSGIRGQGERSRYAAGGELAVPLAKMDSAVGQVDAKLAARYDYYDDASDVSGAFTYQAGLSWKPIESLMFRASRATSFRAPDMHVMFAERSSSYTSGVDYLTCVQTEQLTSGQSWQGCATKYGTGSIRQYSEGDRHLREETGYTDSLGVVAQLGAHHSFTLDAFRIHLEDQVGIIGADTVLQYAAECKLGFTASGQEVDPASPKCVAMLARVTRGAKGRVTSVITSPFNTGMHQQDGFDFNWASRFDGTPYGNFGLRVGYTHILKTLDRYLTEDPVEDIRDAQWNSEFRTRSYGTLTWDLDRFNASLHINRLGTSPERWADGYRRMPAWTTANLSLGWKFNEQFRTTLSVTNLLDRRPPLVDSEKWWPYADISKYNPTGAEYFLTLEYKLR